jgi:hypothetical protein
MLGPMQPCKSFNGVRVSWLCGLAGAKQIGVDKRKTFYEALRQSRGRGPGKFEICDRHRGGQLATCQPCVQRRVNSRKRSGLSETNRKIQPCGECVHHGYRRVCSRDRPRDGGGTTARQMAGAAPRHPDRFEGQHRHSQRPHDGGQRTIQRPRSHGRDAGVRQGLGSRVIAGKLRRRQRIPSVALPRAWHGLRRAREGLSVPRRG